MTIPKILPPGTNHLTASKQVAARMQGAADAAIENHVGPRPAGPKRVMKAEMLTKTIRHVTATKTTHGS
jgi:hypothetical protein